MQYEIVHNGRRVKCVSRTSALRALARIFDNECSNRGVDPTDNESSWLDHDLANVNGRVWQVVRV